MADQDNSIKISVDTERKQENAEKIIDTFEDLDWSVLFQDEEEAGFMKWIPVMNTILLIVLLFLSNKK